MLSGVLTRLRKAKTIATSAITAVGIISFMTNAPRSKERGAGMSKRVRNKDKYDIQVFSYALNEYMKGKSKNLNNLMKYAKALRIEEKVRMYTEVMI